MYIRIYTRTRRRTRRPRGLGDNIQNLHIPLLRLLLQQAVLPFEHFPKDNTAVDLGCGEGNVQQRGADFECYLPLAPQATEQPHGHRCLREGAAGCGDT